MSVWIQGSWQNKRMEEVILYLVNVYKYIFCACLLSVKFSHISVDRISDFFFLTREVLTIQFLVFVNYIFFSWSSNLNKFLYVKYVCSGWMICYIYLWRHWYKELQWTGTCSLVTVLAHREHILFKISIAVSFSSSFHHLPTMLQLLHLLVHILNDM